MTNSIKREMTFEELKQCGVATGIKSNEKEALGFLTKLGSMDETETTLSLQSELVGLIEMIYSKKFHCVEGCVANKKKWDSIHNILDRAEEFTS